MRVSVILPNRDNEPTLDMVLSKLEENTTWADFELVVVDDGSRDTSREILRRWRDSGRFARFVYEEQEPSGVVVTLNRCLELATGDVIVQMDADATVETPGWTEKMVALLERDEAVGVVTAKVVFDRKGPAHALGINLLGPEGFHDRGTEVLEKVGRRSYHQRVLRFREEEVPGGDAIAEVDAGIGCCMMYRRADALAVGGYDLGFQPVWFDDADLALSIRAQLNKKVFFTPEVRVVHHVSARTTREDAKLTPREQVIRAGAFVAKLLPPKTRHRIGYRMDLDLPEGERWDRLQHHYAYWREKWGWDMLNPDLDAVRERWGDTEVWWRYDDARRAAGQRIIDAHRAAA